ncbi:MAG: acetate kinase [Defluviitaleaceae bacterium]|nr:acetate kinase [Defluviitaleaceae bacterium]
MKILVLNCGSSSLKYQFIDMINEKVLAKGLCERIGLEASGIKHEGRKKIEKEIIMEDHKDAISSVIEAILDKEHGVIENINEVSAIGHRVVHGGEKFSESVVITNEIYNAIKECSELAPLHNPPNLMGIDACNTIMPNIPQVAVFDTAFHQSIPEYSYLYAIPLKYYEKYKIRRYGFHGTSHKYVSNRVCEITNKNIKDLKIITAHLGNGCSICAIDGGNSIDTSMGFTPLEGLIMGTRSGDLDPAIVSFIATKENISTKEVEDILNKKSGVFGLSNVSSDFRDLEDAASKGNKNAEIALKAFFYRVAKYIGSYVASLNGVDIIVFTAGLGENSAFARESILSYLSYLGISINTENNNTRGKEIKISTDESKVDVYVIPTNEELVIARDTYELCK